MPYMMTDLAAGSRAAEQFQQDIAAAPYTQDLTQAASERKIQEDRLAKQYAPEEAAAKAEKLQFLRDQERINALYAPAKAATQQTEDTYRLQTQMNAAQTAETERLFKEAGYKADTESTDKFKTWMSSEDGKKATDIQRLEKAAQFKSEFGLTKQAADLHTQIENINTKETANKAKELKNANESLASARALIKNVPDEEVSDYIKRLPDNLQKNITDRIGEDNWNKLGGKQKKEVLDTLFQDAKQQVDIQIKEIEAQKTIDAAKEVTKRSNYRADKQAEFKGKGNSGDSTKQDAKNFSDVMRIDERLEKESVKGVDALDKKIAAAEKTRDAAKQKSINWFDKDVEKERTAASTAVDQAKENKDKYVKQQLEKRIKVLETAPTYPGKQAYIDSLKKELSLYGGDEPPPVKEGAAAPASAADTARLDADEAALKREIARTPAKETERLGILNKELEDMQSRRTAAPASEIKPVVKYRTPEQYAKDTNADPNISKEAKASMIARYTAGYPDAIAEQKATSNKGAVGTQSAPIPFEPGKTVPENGKYYSNNRGDVAMWDESKGKMVAGEPPPSVSTTSEKPVVSKEDTTKYIREKGPRGNWIYTESPRGQTKAKYAEIDANKPATPAVAPATTTAKDTSTDFSGAKSADLIREGNIDLTKRPVVKNKDGSISTVRSMSFEEDGMQILIPTVVGDKVVSDKAAIDHYRKTGEHLGMFSSVKAANAYAKKLHEEQDKMYSGKKEDFSSKSKQKLAEIKDRISASEKRTKESEARTKAITDELKVFEDAEKERLRKLAEGE